MSNIISSERKKTTDAPVFTHHTYTALCTASYSLHFAPKKWCTEKEYDAMNILLRQKYFLLDFYSSFCNFSTNLMNFFPNYYFILLMHILLTSKTSFLFGWHENQFSLHSKLYLCCVNNLMELLHNLQFCFFFSAIN